MNTTITMEVSGMMCAHCEARVKKALEAVEGVVSANASHESGTVVVETDGVAALLAMLNSCASGVSVVNIDNGFGAGYQASLINHVR